LRAGRLAAASAEEGGDAAARAARAGKPIGILAPVEEDARRFLDMGYNYVALGSDAGLLRTAAEQLRGRFQ